MRERIETLWKKDKSPLMIAGPCSAESEEQLRLSTQLLSEIGVKVIRAGIWKPRTRPNTFEGIGSPALQWIKDIKKDFDVQFAIEVATAQHVELALEYGVDVLWIGARTTVNPFTVQEIADSLKGVDIPVLVKNPINPDLALWLGALERLSNAGISKLGAIHRGFSSHRKSKYRNEPLWQIPIELKRLHPDLPLIGDPSHIAGERGLIEAVSQKALDVNYDGLMIEVHPNPDKALSDAKQQITPATLERLLGTLQVRSATSDNALFLSKLEQLRDKIDEVDQELIQVLRNRMDLVDELGVYKKENNVSIFQLNRWKDIMQSRGKWAEDAQLRREFIEDIYKIIHEESIKKQTSISEASTTSK
ncbi:bifunctional 3-deoxy-7-phosphoheptulonate synthase/chorismate mutase type II [Fulvivirga lutea]|uniref:chorismate mutase n=1 Tax=Fulvivirga lutea TaxID=2810512 RepID=A0A975A1P7_9BACT|nr:bifunctional 3-deoxy-7-phosphoheptulonate synthase/chorismate mutase type II [Fulvivirga lutea]QSE97752.1 bifunctional 3-deoxy-7-phosphoheptulonate synthase/chorismate mutase type II [Fulvivirga lutea]